MKPAEQTALIKTGGVYFDEEGVVYGRRLFLFVWLGHWGRVGNLTA